MTVEPWDPYELVKCPRCNGTGRADIERKRTMIRRVCRHCLGDGVALLGEHPSSPWGLIIRPDSWKPGDDAPAEREVSVDD